MDENPNLKEFHFTIWDFAVFIAMLTASSGIGVYFAFKVIITEKKLKKNFH